MQKSSRIAALTAAMTLSAGLAIAGGAERAMAQAANPCAPKAANPCAAKAGGKPEIAAKLFQRPAGTKLASGDRAQLVKQGKSLFSSTKLSTNDMSCASCHQDNANFADDFAKPYPHQVAMAQEKGGVSQIQLDEMIQLCMIVPMAAKTLPWNSRELAALTAYTSELQVAFRKQGTKPAAGGANPCAPKAANPCAPKAANPCAPKKK